MAITNYKKVEDSKGYFLNDKDRKIFERELSRGYFGFYPGDVIEFIVYDSNDNPLPQESAEGNNVRYIEYSDKNYKEYFGKTQINKSNVSKNQSEEFFIDIEKLLKEAGYSQGVFKTSVTLLNKRLGSELKQNDNVWIQEISPSRTEIRILPTIDINGVPNSELEQRYQCFINGEIFAADIYPFLDQFVEQFDVQQAIEEMYKSKGAISNGINYVKLIESEFKIPSFDILIKNIKDKFIQSVKYYKTNREWNLNSPKYGQPLTTQPQLCFKQNEILNVAIEIVTQCIEFFLPKRNINDKIAYTLEEQKTLDELEVLTEQARSKIEIPTQIPPPIIQPIVGCMDPKALNYNPNAEVNDSSLCVYEPVAPPVKPPVIVEPPSPPIIDKPTIIRSPKLPIISLSDKPKPIDEVKPEVIIPNPKPKPIPIISKSDRLKNFDDVIQQQLPSDVINDFILTTPQVENNIPIRSGGGGRNRSIPTPDFDGSFDNRFELRTRITKQEK